MILKNKNQFRPVYKQLVKLKENIQNRKKLLRFKKKKWNKLIHIYKRQLSLHKKIKPKDQTQYLISRHPSTNFSYKKQYKIISTENKKFKLIYGGLSCKTMLHKNCKITTSIFLLKFFESRLDVTLYRAKFGLNLRFVRQLIFHNKIIVNNKTVKIKSFLLKPGDIIKIKPNYSKLINTTVLKFDWPVYPKHLIINYKIMEIVFNSLSSNNTFLNVFYHLNLDKVLFKSSKN